MYLFWPGSSPSQIMAVWFDLSRFACINEYKVCESTCKLCVAPSLDVPIHAVEANI